MANERKDTITVYDSQGRVREMPRAEWADTVLPKMLQASWNDANALYQQIAFALSEGFAQRVLDAARRLDELDRGAERGRVVHAAVELDNGRAQEAEAILRACIAAHGESSISVVNLARVRAGRGDAQEAERLVKRALELDSNHESALGWWLDMVKRRSDETEALRELESIAAKTGNWRAQLWLAGQRVRAGKLPEALALYQRALPGATRDPGGLLSVTAELGRAGKLAEMVDLALPLYDEQRHRPEIGLNLLQALVQLGRVEPAKTLLARLQRLAVPPLKPVLDRFASQLGLPPAAPSPREQKLELRLVSLSGPTWIRGLRDARWLGPEKHDAAPLVVVATLGDEALASEKGKRVDEERARITRSLALYLAESLHLRTSARAECVLPMVPGGTFVVAGRAWPAEMILKARGDAPKPAAVVTGVLAEDEGGSRVELTVSDGTTGAEIQRLRAIGLRRAELAAQRLEGELAQALEARGVKSLGGTGRVGRWLGRRAATLDATVRPAAEELPRYLAAIEQLAAQALCAMRFTSREHLTDETRLLARYFELCSALPDLAAARAIAACGVAFSYRYGSPHSADAAKQLAELAEREKEGLARRLAPLMHLEAGELERFEAARREAAAQAGDDALYRTWLDALKA